MSTSLTRVLSLLGLLLATSATSQANDIVDFLKAINGNSGRRSAPVVTQPVGRNGHGRALSGGSDHSDHRDHGHSASTAARGSMRAASNNINLRPNQYVAPPSRSGLQVNLRFASNAGVNQGYAPPLYIPQQPQVRQLPPVQAYPTFPGRSAFPSYPEIAPTPWELGQFIDCQVPLAPCVRVEDERNIAPNAIPVIVAVRDPGMCIHDVQERLVFVRIFVPPCPLRDLRVSPCRTRISLDYGRYEVDIKSADGMIVVDYDD